MRVTKRILGFVLSIAMILGLAACRTSSGEEEKVTIRVGARDWAAQYIMMELMAYALEQNGYEAERVPDIGGTSLVHQAMVNDEIDLAADYSSNFYSSLLGHEPIFDRETVYNVSKEEMLEQYDTLLLDESEINDSYGLFMLKSVAEQYGIETMSDLAPYTHEFVFANHGSWLENNKDRMIELYGGDFEWKEVKLFDTGLRYTSVLTGEADVSTAYLSDGELYNEELYLIIDDKETYKPYYIIPYMRNDVAEEYPEVVEIINELFASMTTEDLATMTRRASVDKEDYDVVAQEWYDTKFN